MNAITAYDQLHRRLHALVLIVALCAGLVVPVLIASPASAQGGSGRPISVGDIVTGTLDAENVMQVYSLVASAGDVITADVSTETPALAPVIAVTNASGDIVAQDLDVGTATTATLTDVALPVTGTYYILVLRGSGAEGPASGTFTLRLSGIQQVGGQTLTLEDGGITVDLQWGAAVDLNLEVRDPVGGEVHRFSPGAPSGGTLDADINAVCAGAVATSPTETIAWPAGTVPVGSYEIIVYYSDGCGVGGPQVFSLTATVNGETAQLLNGTLNPGQEYLARLELGPTGDWLLVNGGVNAGLSARGFTAEIAAAAPVALGSTVSGMISNAAPAKAYSFTASAATTVVVDLRAQSGSLDPYVALLGPNGNEIASNDDAGDTADAGLSVVLPVDGQYTIVATRYGLAIGGTEGEFALSVSGTAASVGTPAPEVTPGAVVTAVGPQLTEGSIEVKLEWATQADLQLQVRDPSGDTVYDDIPQIRSGGTLEADGNVGCLEPTDTPVSYIYWPLNRLTPGTYEVEVWYQDTCNDTRPVTFGLSVNVNQQTIINTTQGASPRSRYMITFKIESDGTATAGPGDFFDMTNAATLDYLPTLANATPMAYGQTVSGSITEQQRFQTYAFEGQAGDRITIGMNASGGTLDPALYLISPENIQVAFNDDVTPGENPNSVIERVTLASTGTYYILATHYGLNVGGTTGTYSLTLVQD